MPASWEQRRVGVEHRGVGRSFGSQRFRSHHPVIESTISGVIRPPGLRLHAASHGTIILARAR